MGYSNAASEHKYRDIERFFYEDNSEEEIMTEGDHIALAFSEDASEHIAMFSLSYFGIPIKDLNEEQRHEIDCFGLYGCIGWLNDHVNSE